jgi:hypothetical protein
LLSEFSEDQYCVAAHRADTGGRSARVQVLFREEAAERAVLQGLLHAHVARRLLAEAPVSGGALDLVLVREARRVLCSPGPGGAASLLDAFLKELCAARPDPERDWAVDGFVLERDRCRFTVTRG